MANYKLPICWIGNPIGRAGVIVLGNHTYNTEVVTMADCNPNCHCLHPMQSHFCMEGHMTECHAGMNCEEADCSHYSREEDSNNDEEN